MIWGKWLNPNFKFRATDDASVVWEYCCYASSEQELRGRLEKKLLTVEYIRTYDFAVEWEKRAQAATKKAVDAYLAGKRPINFRDEIWAELKWHLFELFRGKCAYCEGKTLDVASGDVEHYRPKAKVDEDPGHPGYYWLAYNVTNLLPSCELCNRTRGGKMTHFPVLGAHARAPQELPNERPLLLNPYDHTVDPFEHLEFDDAGKAMAHNNSQYGNQSRICYHLNRPGLGEARGNAMARVKQEWDALAVILSSPGNRHTSFREELTLGIREYSAAQRWQLDRIAEKGGV
jgi:hypothetical protein